MSKLVFAFLSCALAIGSAEACRVGDIPLEQRAETAEQLLLGTVVKITTIAPKNRKQRRIANKQYRILVSHSSLQNAVKVQDIQVDWCGGGSAEVGDEVVVVQSSSTNAYISWAHVDREKALDLLLNGF